MPKFQLTGACEECGDRRPHPPHKTGRYTAGHICLFRFCPGGEGRTEDGRILRIEREKSFPGRGTKPSVLKREWWLE